MFKLEFNKKRHNRESYECSYEKIKEIGLLLQKKRLEANLSVLDIASELMIHEDVISNIESGNVEEVIKTLYYQGCVISYAKILKLNHKKISDYIERDLSIIIEKNAQIFKEMHQKNQKMHDALSIKIVVIIVAVCLGTSIANTIIQKNQEDQNILALISKTR